jgi:hypothetical protein
VLARLIEERLRALWQRSDKIPAIPLDLAAAQAAGAQLGLVRAWLNRSTACSAAAVAAALHQSATASIRALFSLGQTRHRPSLPAEHELEGQHPRACNPFID